MILALILAGSCCMPPKEGSFCEVAPQPTVWSCVSLLILIWGYGSCDGMGLTAREESIFGENGYCVHEEDGYCTGLAVRTGFGFVFVNW